MKWPLQRAYRLIKASCTFDLSTINDCKELKRIKTSKSTGLSNIPARMVTIPYFFILINPLFVEFKIMLVHLFVDNLFFVSILKYLLYFLFLRCPSCIDQDIQWWHKGKGRWSCEPTVFCWRWTSNYFQLGKRPEATGKFYRKGQTSSQFFPCCNSERPNKFWKIYLSHPRPISKHYSYNFDPERYR